MAVQHNVDLVLAQDPQAYLPLDRARCAKEDVRDVGGQHRAAPSVGQGSTHGLIQEVFCVLVVAHVCAVQHLDDLTVDTARCDAMLLPQLLALDRRALEVLERAVRLAKLGQGSDGYVVGDVVYGTGLLVFVHCRDVQVAGYLDELLWVSYCIVTRLAFCHF